MRTAAETQATNSAEDLTDAARERRRDVELRGFGVLADGTTFSLTVLNLSYDGCQIATSLALLPGVKLKISIVGLGRATEAVVRWSKDGRAGLRLYPGEDSESSRIARSHCRIEVTAHLSLRRQGRQHYVARLFGLTMEGCRVEFVERPRRGENLWVKFANLESIEASVQWVDGFHGGLKFVRPIYPAVFDMLIARLQGE